MKENNKTKYLLGLCLLGIWSVLGFRFYEKFSRNESITLIAANSNINDPKQKKIFNYALILDYADPFTGKKSIRIPQKTATLPKRNISRKVDPAKFNKHKKVRFPQVEYKGNIVNANGKVAAIVKINKEFLNLNLFESHQDIEITKIFQDSIVIRKEGVEKTVVR